MSWGKLKSKLQEKDLDEEFEKFMNEVVCFCFILLVPIEFFENKTSFIFFTQHSNAPKILPRALKTFLNPSCGDSLQRKDNLNFYFHSSLWCLKRFHEGF